MRKLQRTWVKRRRTGPPRRSSRAHNPAYLAWLRTMPCAICYARAYAILGISILCEFGSTCYPTHAAEAAHVGWGNSSRGMSQKHSDDTAIPLCRSCHTEGKQSVHAIGPVEFFAHHGTDRDETIRSFQRLYREHCK